MSPELDLALPGMLKTVAKTVLADIDDYCVRTYNDGFRNHLGASVIGRECERALWYTFRWAKAVVFDGRRYRLFNRGHREEDRFAEWLTGIGATFYPHDPASGKQWRVSSVGGHFGGSMDGKLVLPPRYNYSKPILTEFKTNGTGRGFDMLAQKGVALAKPEHFAQQSVYGYLEKLDYALYANINKNDDSLYVEMLKLDHKLGADMERKASKIIMLQEAPRRHSDSPNHTTCQTCDYLDICHQGKPLAPNCRSCKFAEPRDNKEWFCGKWSAVIPTREAIQAGCGDWKPIA